MGFPIQVASVEAVVRPWAAVLEVVPVETSYFCIKVDIVSKNTIFRVIEWRTKSYTSEEHNFEDRVSNVTLNEVEMSGFFTYFLRSG